MFAQSADALALKLIRSLLRVETESDSQLPRIDSQTAIRIQLFRALKQVTVVSCIFYSRSVNWTVVEIRKKK